MEDVFAWGSGSYGRLGLGHSKDAVIPVQVSGVLNGCDVRAGSCGWYHSAVVTSTGDVATFGSKVTSCLGSAASDSEDSDNGKRRSESDDSDYGFTSDGLSSDAAEGLAAGRPRLRRRGSAGAAKVAQPGRPVGSLVAKRRLTRPHAAREENYVPRMVRSFPSRVTIVQVAVGGDMLGAHTLAVSRTGRLYSWGYGPACGLGSTANVNTPTLVTKFLGYEQDTCTRDMEMEPLAWRRHSHTRYRHRSTSTSLGLQMLRPKIVKAVCGGGFSGVLSSEGEVFTFGLSAGGRLGFRSKLRAQLRPRRLESLREGTTDLSAGAGFMLICTAAGRLFTWGDNAKGQLGIGHLQESYEPQSLGRVCPAAFVFQTVAAGDSHALALDSAGHIYSWGGEGGPMTGQGQPLPDSSQIDAAFQFRVRQLSHWWVRPREVQALSGTRVLHIAAGCLHSVALARGGVLFAWGAMLQAGVTADGAAPLPQVSWVPRLIAPSPKLPLVRVTSVTAGGWHSMTTAVPSCAIESLHPRDIEGVEYANESLFMDGFLLAAASGNEEVRVALCCAAVRARLALPDGSDSVVWKALSMQIKRCSCPAWLDGAAEAYAEAEAKALAARADSMVAPKLVDSEASGEGESLMDIVAMRRPKPAPSERLPPRQRRVAAKVNHPCEADEAAGKPVVSTPNAIKPLLSKPSPDKAPLKRPVAHLNRIAAKRATPIFSSDSSDECAAPKTRAPPVKSRPPLVESRGGSGVGKAMPTPIPIFSSDSSDEDVCQASSRSAVPAPLSARHLPHPETVAITPRQPGGSARRSSVGPVLAKAPQPEPHLSVKLSDFGEPVLHALVRFLHTDALGNLEVIDDAHPLVQGPRTSLKHMSKFDEDIEPPTRQRARKGLLLRREIDELRRLGTALCLERLTRLCDQLLLRVDAPGAPALFVPASTLGQAMWTLMGHALPGPSKNGPDTRILCGPRGTRRRRWGHKAAPLGGEVWAHAFVVCAGCEEVVNKQAACRLKCVAPVGSGSHNPMSALATACFELDLREWSEELVFAWWRYLYTQDDLLLLWPCAGRTREESAAGEAFWMDLLRLAQRLGDWRLQLYAQDTLAGALSVDNWAQMATFAEQANCRTLSEAALMMGVRRLLPAVLRSFRVPTGLEDPSKSPHADATEETPAVATVSTAASRSGVAFHGQVELEIERRVLSIGLKDKQPTVLLDLKRASPGQFGELKHRLGENVKSAQQIADQLQRCARFFDQKSPESRRGDQTDRRRTLLMELGALVGLLSLAVMPSTHRAIASGASAASSLVPLLRMGWSAVTSSVAHVFLVNVMAILVILAILWRNLKG